MPRYRRIRLTRGQSLASAAVSLAVGAGAAVTTWYLTRILLSRDALTPAGSPPGASGELSPADSSGAILASTGPRTDTD